MRTIAIIIFFFAFRLHAAEQKLHIILKTGNYVSLSIESQPKIVFEDGVMYVGNETFLVSNVSKYLVGDEEVLSIDNVSTDDMRIKLTDAEDGTIHIENYSGQTIKMYAVNGMEVPCKISILGGQAVVDFSALPNNPYILTVGNETFKIQKR